MMGKTVLFVCSGNTCRSPLAAALTRKMMADGGNSLWTVKSAGLAVFAAAPASAAAAAVAAEYGLTLSEHCSRRLTSEMLADADLVLVMTASHKVQVLQKSPQSAGKVHTLKEYAGRVGDVEDPFGGGLSAYRAMARELADLTALILKKLHAEEKKSRN